MATYINLDNLARYDLKAKARAEGLYADASAACWQKTEKAGAVTCVPAPETPLEPVVEFLFKETLPVGDKSSQNPSTITGMSSIGVGRRLINCFSLIGLRSSVGDVSISVDSDGTITLNGTYNTTVDGRYWIKVQIPVPIVRYAGQYLHMRADVVSGSMSTTGERDYVLVEWPEKNTSTGVVGYRYIRPGNSSASNTFSVSAVDNTTVSDCNISIYGGQTFNNYKLRIMVAISDSSEMPTYEPANIITNIIPLGSTFYGGTLDVASGRLTVTHRMVEPSSGTVDISDRPALLPLEYTDTYGRTVTSADGTSLDCGTSGGQIVYKLATPYTVQIDPTPIDSLPALDKTSPRVNTIYTDAESVQVGYAEHPAYTEELINNAILALGGDI